MKLAIISHTEHYTTPEGRVVGWSPTVNEINHLLDVFDNIVHVAMHHDGPAPKSTMAYTSDRIQFVPLPAVGGPKLGDKLQVLSKAPSVIRTVSRVLQEVDYFQLRTPTGIGVFLIPYLTLFSKCKGWYKYAGNWNQPYPPLGYRLQKLMLKIQRSPVTINGCYPHQPKHFLSFENPCLTLNDLDEGIKICQIKKFNLPISFCFVGRLEEAKGVDRIIEAFGMLEENDRKKVAQIHLVGDSEKRKDYECLAKKTDLPFIFHGFLYRDNVFDIYKQCQVILLPSKSEGFPKVIPEAMNFGCIPVVSNVSSIEQYIINHETGYLLEQLTSNSLKILIKSILDLNTEDYVKILKKQRKILSKFTYVMYNSNIKKQLLSEFKKSE